MNSQNHADYNGSHISDQSVSNLQGEYEDWMDTDVVLYDYGQVIPGHQNLDKDQFETMNRAIFKFNKALDFILIHPTAQMYKRAMPTIAQNSIKNIIANMFLPLQGIYAILSANPKLFSQTYSKFTINTVFGVLGLFDAANKYPSLKTELFIGGDLLKRYGGTDGPYVVLPIFGPSSIRKTFGLLLDIAIDPLNYYMNSTPIFIRGSMIVINARADMLDVTADIEALAIDDYVMMRSIYLQNAKR